MVNVPRPPTRIEVGVELNLSRDMDAIR